jgi:hypothetical protein
MLVSGFASLRKPAARFAAAGRNDEDPLFISSSWALQGQKDFVPIGKGDAVPSAAGGLARM